MAGSRIEVDRLLGEHGVPADTKTGRREFERRTEMRRSAKPDGEWGPIRRGRCLGGEDFREELRAAVQDRLREEHPADLRVESAEQKAERIVTEELSRRGWTEGELGRRAKGEAEKAGIALRIRRERTVTLAWIAARLVMGSPGNGAFGLPTLRRRPLKAWAFAGRRCIRQLSVVDLVARRREAPRPAAQRHGR